jgi:hypothetical protein
MLDPALAWTLFVASAAMFVVGLIGLPVVLVRLPADYFARRHKPLESLRGRHPAVRWVVLVGKNLLGALLVLVGIPLLPLPGQGLLMIVVGLSLTDLPGKQALLSRIVGRPRIRAAINALRRRFGRPPLADLGRRR